MRDPVLAGILSLVIPGVGQIYNGRILAGIIWLILTPGFWIGTGGTLGWICDLVSAYCAYSYAKEHPVRIGLRSHGLLWHSLRNVISIARLIQLRRSTSQSGRRTLRNRNTHGRDRIAASQNRTAAPRNPNVRPATISNREQRRARNRRL